MREQPRRIGRGVGRSITRPRLSSILATLGQGDSLAFTRLQSELDLTPGNLITHLRKLEDAGYEVSDSAPALDARRLIDLAARGSETSVTAEDGGEVFGDPPSG